MRLMLAIYALMALPQTAEAAEVVWLHEGDAGVTEWLAGQALAKRGPLTPLQFRGAATDWSPADDQQWRDLEDTLRDVRQYETKLDGELIIMDQLTKPIASISVIRNEGDRAALFSALAYQGFAVDRFFDATLPTDARAEKYRTTFNGVQIALPWADAVALDPMRDVTPYDIAEAPQRIHYSAIQSAVKNAVPALLAPDSLPENSQLFADGREVAPGPSGTISVVPGRHHIHLLKDGVILARWDIRVESAARVELKLPFADAMFDEFLTSVRMGTTSAPPPELIASIQALGGEVWLAEPVDGPRGPWFTAWRVTETTVEPIVIEQPNDDKLRTGLSVTGGVGGGWLASGDFYNQNPENVPNTKSTVNAGTLTANLAVDVDFTRWLRIGVGVDTPLTLGENHVAEYAAQATRVRPYVYGAAGWRYAQLTGGYTFPMHPTIGLRGSLPLWKGLETAAHFTVGLPTTRERPNTSTYTSVPLYALNIDVAWRQYLTGSR